MSHLLGRGQATTTSVRRGPYNQKAEDKKTAICQKCNKPGHWTYECKTVRSYVKRASRSAIVEDPKKAPSFSHDLPPGYQSKEDRDTAAAAANGAGGGRQGQEGQEKEGHKWQKTPAGRLLLLLVRLLLLLLLGQQ